jgi:hypothetical protein
MSRYAWLTPLCTALLLWAAPARAEDSQPPRPAGALSEEDREVVENLELLESLEAVDDLELLLALSEEEQQQ